ncbi:3'-5' exonuclease [Clostridium estertheticum]|uniref:3'-5' exonuclease n=1 Tax=Clostridium estertheticum TaxID=238834 RepID=UPI001CF172E1|nr:3'-5' exonuclease [Clostridium estertheticum]MCB2308849.1 3'-5' exonuclease [Clostridium estertheticum]MCB2347261.1 3'-5' exonuclease [Clostridium estertheticum]MCB2351898.1 3'-5' exonuclease [Clostridium estertheticum]WAG48464.1 3'-5' exonuclease [Clostridium estertheticum]
MVKKLFIDTETSGFKPGQIAQLTYTITEDDKVTVATNFFLACDYIDPGAEKIHGFSVDRLKVLSGGKTFKDIAAEVADDLKDCIFIAHNAKFDINFVKTEIERAGYAFEIGETFCTMKYFENIIKLKGKYGKYKWPKLEETMQFLGIDSESKGFNKGLQKLYGDDGISFHDARFDVCGLIMVYYKAMKMGYEM